MQLEQLLAALTPDMYARIKGLVETGKWFDGAALEPHQRELLLQAVMIYQAKVEQSGEHMTIGADGEIVQKSRQELKNELKMAQESLIARFKKHDI
ncbi:YeaC family protein [Alteromonas flava]|uniref:YeaC family protein n=1 Tax=Alteromonas flava TaxID=2048003 RepID=UPI000C28910D|nr:DUF1315 family protein [Alteromonas flava]